MASSDKKKKAEDESKKFDPVTLATWARLRAAGKAPMGGKPFGAEISSTPKKKEKKKK